MGWGGGGRGRLIERIEWEWVKPSTPARYLQALDSSKEGNLNKELRVSRSETLGSPFRAPDPHSIPPKNSILFEVRGVEGSNGKNRVEAFETPDPHLIPISPRIIREGEHKQRT